MKGVRPSSDDNATLWVDRFSICHLICRQRLLAFSIQQVERGLQCQMVRKNANTSICTCRVGNLIVCLTNMMINKKSRRIFSISFDTSSGVSLFHACFSSHSSQCLPRSNLTSSPILRASPRLLPLEEGARLLSLALPRTTSTVIIGEGRTIVYKCSQENMERKHEEAGR